MMKFMLCNTIFSTIEFDHLIRLRLKSFCQNYLDEYLRDKDYGSDVKEIELHIILVEERFFIFHKATRPRYYEHYTEPKSDICLSKEPETYIKRFCMDSRISPEDFTALLKASDEEIDAILARHIYKSLDTLDRLPKRLNDFDKVRFKKDMGELFRSHGWL